MQRIFRTKAFTRWMRKAGLTDGALRGAVSEMVEGLIDADLGGNLLKKRIALPGRGKRGGVRTIVATKRADKWFFLFGFEKNVRANISQVDVATLQEFAQMLLGADDTELAESIATGQIVEVCDGDNDS